MVSHRRNHLRSKQEYHHDVSQVGRGDRLSCQCHAVVSGRQGSNRPRRRRRRRLRRAVRRPRRNCQSPFGVDFDKAGNLYFVEMTGQPRRQDRRQGHAQPLCRHRQEGRRRRRRSGRRRPSSTACTAWPSRATATSTLPIPGTTASARSTPRPASSRTFAGTGEKGFSGDGGPAVQGEVRRHLLPGPRCRTANNSTSPTSTTGASA